MSEKYGCQNSLTHTSRFTTTVKCSQIIFGKFAKFSGHNLNGFEVIQLFSERRPQQLILSCLSKHFLHFQGVSVNFNCVLFPLEPVIQFTCVAFKTEKKAFTFFLTPLFSLSLLSRQFILQPEHVFAGKSKDSALTLNHNDCRRIQLIGTQQLNSTCQF